MQTFISSISSLMAEKNLPALMIGGHAVVALGHPRATYDLDLLIPRSSADDWSQELQKRQFRIFSQNRNFWQFESSMEYPLPAMDLMLVDNEVYENLAAGKIGTDSIPTPGPTALVALKLHAIVQKNRARNEQDWQDIFGLMRAQNLSLDVPDFHDIVLKYGGEKAIRRIKGESAP